MNKKKLLLALTISGTALFSSMNLNAGIPVSPEYLNKQLDTIRTTPDLWARTCTAGHDLTKGCSTADLSMTASSADAQMAWIDVLQATGFPASYGVTAKDMINSGAVVVVRLSGQQFGKNGPTGTLGSGGNGGNSGAVAYVQWGAYTVSGIRLDPLVAIDGHVIPTQTQILSPDVAVRYSDEPMFLRESKEDIYLICTAFDEQGNLVTLSSGSISWDRNNF